ncbi:hypothetical protein [Ruminococcus sp. Marseille-P6503]|uniref:hypothetical protein n=1 Tax=Ruminococcus sp. Marseille-P6503 TaxID=2364796 RepID=UPI000F5225BA|nr:hypothetical protein [Ruminococcus sp. Marseille-P6503]
MKKLLSIIKRNKHDIFLFSLNTVMEIECFIFQTMYNDFLLFPCLVLFLIIISNFINNEFENNKLYRAAVVVTATYITALIISEINQAIKYDFHSGFIPTMISTDACFFLVCVAISLTIHIDIVSIDNLSNKSFSNVYDKVLILLSKAIIFLLKFKVVMFSAITFLFAYIDCLNEELFKSYIFYNFKSVLIIYAVLIGLKLTFKLSNSYEEKVV